MDMTVALGIHKFSLQATIDHHGSSMHSGHYTDYINCYKKTFYCNDRKIAEFEMIDTKTALLLMWQCINWLHNGFWTRTGGSELLPWCWHILYIPLKAGRGIRAETYGLDDVFPSDNLGSGQCNPFIIYIPCIITAILVIKINSFYETCIPKVGVAKLVYWMIWYCYCFLLVSSVHFSCMVQYSLYHNIDMGTMWHCTLVSSNPSVYRTVFSGVRCSGVECH